MGNLLIYYWFENYICFPTHGLGKTGHKNLFLKKRN